MANERITATDNAQSAIMKLAEGNPGALSVCCQLYKEAERIDPDAIFGGLSVLLSLDSFNIYGADIWMLYKDVCRESLVDVCAVLRGVQLGIVPLTTLQHAIQNRGEGLDVRATFAAVCERLPNFEKANALEAAEIA